MAECRDLLGTSLLVWSKVQYVGEVLRFLVSWFLGKEVRFLVSCTTVEIARSQQDTTLLHAPTTLVFVTAVR